MARPAIIITIAAILGLISVIAGAAGTHALRDTLDAGTLRTFETAARFQMYHALALLATGMLSMRWQIRALTMTHTPPWPTRLFNAHGTRRCSASAAASYISRAHSGIGSALRSAHRYRHLCPHRRHLPHGRLGNPRLRRLPHQIILPIPSVHISPPSDMICQIIFSTRRTKHAQQRRHEAANTRR